MKKNIRYGVVQGRLTQSPPGCLQWFPQDCWEAEFGIASDLGVNYIELIAEVQHNQENPIWSDDGINKITQLVANNGLTLHALCNDYIVEHSLLNADVIQQNIDLIKQGKKLGVEKYIMPLFESSELSVDNMNEFVKPLRIIAEAANKSNMVVCLETILTGKELIELFKLINLSYVRAVYDTGNRVAFGHDIAADICFLGDYIAHVHIKDKNSNNENVLLGTGMVNFEQVFDALDIIKYGGPFTFETTRGTHPINTVKYNMQLVQFFKTNADKNV
jgi:L-ribulose-5-phosphate 3-epimerase